jgi:hypothetical protein
MRWTVPDQQPTHGKMISSKADATKWRRLRPAKAIGCSKGTNGLATGRHYTELSFNNLTYNVELGQRDCRGNIETGQRLMIV